MAKYDKEKNLVSTEFLADEKKRAEGFNGPGEILNTFLELIKMFNPDAIHNDGVTQGGISAKNIRKKSITEDCLSDEVSNKIFVIMQTLSALSDSLDSFDEHISNSAKKIDLLEEKHIQEYNMIISRLNEISTLYALADSALKKEIEEALDGITKETLGKIHTHDNKFLLDGITQTDKENFDKNTEARHTHDNSEALSLINTEKIKKIDKISAYAGFTPDTYYKKGDLIFLKNDTEYGFSAGALVAVKVNEDFYLDLKSLEDIQGKAPYEWNLPLEIIDFGYSKVATNFYDYVNEEIHPIIEISDAINEVGLEVDAIKESYMLSPSHEEYYDVWEDGLNVTIEDNKNVYPSAYIEYLVATSVNLYLPQRTSLKYGFSFTFISGETPTELILSGLATKIRFAETDCVNEKLHPLSNKIYNVIFTQVGDEIWADVGARDYIPETEEVVE